MRKVIIYDDFGGVTEHEIIEEDQEREENEDR